MIKTIDSDDLNAKIEKKDSFRLIDVREEDEYQSAFISGAESIPLSSFKQNFSNFITDQNEEIIVTCRSGGRSMAACKFLESRGFKNLTNHEGGILGWSTSGLPVSGEGKILHSSLSFLPDLT